MKWFGPANSEGVEVDELDVRVGGAYRIRFRTTDGEDHGISGVYQEVVPNERLAFSWAWKTTPDRVSRVTILLREVEGGTELEFVHDRFYDETARNNHKRGWTGTFEKLDRFLAS